MRAMQSFVTLVMVFVFCACAYWWLASPEYTIRYQAYATARTAIRQAEEQTKQVQAEEWSNTVRGTVPWLAGGLAAVVAVGIVGWAAVQWQEQRTKRHEASEDNTTQRHLITAQKDIALAYLALCGDPGAFVGKHEGQRGVFLPRSGEFVPESICRAELASAQAATVPTTALSRRQPQTINVPAAMAPDDWLPVGLPGDSDRRFIVRGGW